MGVQEHWIQREQQVPGTWGIPAATKREGAWERGHGEEPGFHFRCSEKTSVRVQASGVGGCSLV